MRIAHIIIAHKNPIQLVRLIKSLHHAEADFYVHIDAKSTIEDFSLALDIAQVSFIKNRVNCNWGGNSLFLGIISAMNEVISLKKNYGFLNLLSAQDYPLMSANRIHKYFRSQLGRNFVSYEFSDSIWWKDATARYERYHFTDFNFRGKNFLEKVADTILPLRKFPIPVKLFGGPKSTWWTISEDCAIYVSNELSTNKKLNKFLKYCWGTDEFVLTTLIMNSHFALKTENNNFRYIDWSEGHKHPKLLNIDDFDAIRNSGRMFARKFDMDNGLLDRIDNELLNV